MTRPPKLYLVLATYNGAAFLPAQLESLQAQSITDWTLLARDDGSSDNTRDILQQAAQRDARIHLLRDNNGRQGTKTNFGFLLEAARDAGAHYVALVDQDDIWRRDKLEKKLLRMREEESHDGKEVPLLVHTDLEVVDAHGRIIHPSFMRLQRISHRSDQPLKTLIVQNFVTGCACLLNRSLLESALPIPHAAIIHDWWIALVAGASGRIAWLPEATLFYRQHKGNQIGAKTFRRSIGDYLRGNQWGCPGELAFARSLAQAGALHERIAGRGSPEPSNSSRRLLAEYLALFELGSSMRARLHRLRQLGVCRQSLVRQGLLYSQVALWRGLPSDPDNTSAQN